MKRVGWYFEEGGVVCTSLFPHGVSEMVSGSGICSAEGNTADRDDRLPPMANSGNTTMSADAAPADVQDKGGLYQIYTIILH